MKAIEIVYLYQNVEEMQKHSNEMYEDGYEYVTVVSGKKGIRVKYKLISTSEFAK